MLEGLSTDEIAEQLGIKRDTASKRMSKARIKLRQCISDLVGRDVDTLFE